jgi:hypothetical protein
MGVPAKRGRDYPRECAGRNERPRRKTRRRRMRGNRRSMLPRTGRERGSALEPGSRGTDRAQHDTEYEGVVRHGFHERDRCEATYCFRAIVKPGAAVDGAASRLCNVAAVPVLVAASDRWHENTAAASAWHGRPAHVNRFVMIFTGGTPVPRQLRSRRERVERGSTRHGRGHRRRHVIRNSEFRDS